VLSPDEIRDRTFLVSLRGFDREEVRAFLDQLAGEVAELQQRLETAEADTDADVPADADATPAPDTGEVADRGPFFEIGEETQRILEAAQAAGEELRKRAQEEAGRELKAARAEAARIIAEAEGHRDDLEAGVRALESARDQLSGDLRDVGRTIERILRELGPQGETTSTMRAALADATWDEAAHEPAPPRTDGHAGGPEVEDATERLAAPDGAAEPDEPGGPSAAGAAAPADGTPDLADVPQATLDEAAGAVATAIRPGKRRSHRGVAEQVPVQARGDALAPSHPKLVRRVKRGLQDIENATLDRLRREPDRQDVDRFLPDQATTTELADLAREHLEAAYAVGYHIGAAAVGQAADDAPRPERDLGRELAAELTGALADDLREQLAAAFGDEADLQALSERVDAAFAVLRDGLVSESSALALVRAYEWGKHDAWSAFGVEGRKWALATEPQCDDPRCEDNAGSGAVPLGQPFPSGHDVPPARPGCSCTTVPSAPGR
jgi:DivIVA domain-containing protein